jgi:hypothetical protein
MGKLTSRTVKRVERRNAPPGSLPSNQEVEMVSQMEEMEENHEEFPILSNLDSPHEEEREYACCSIAHLVESNSELQIILEKGGIKKLMRNLVDNVPSIRVGAAGALRNMSLVVVWRSVREWWRTIA